MRMDLIVSSGTLTPRSEAAGTAPTTMDGNPGGNVA